MIRYLVTLLFLASLVACVKSDVAKQVRPDKLTFPELTFELPAVEQHQLQNGLKLYFKEDHELPLVDITLMIGGGSIEDPLEKAGLASVFAKTLETGGAGNLSPVDLEAELEAMAAELSVSSSTYTYKINLSLHQSDLPRGLEILSALLRQPRFDTERLDLVRKQMLESIRRKNDNPDSVAQRLLHEAIFPGHPFGATPEAESVKAISREDLIKIQQRCLRPENVWFAVSGAVDRPEMINLMQKNLGDWKTENQMLAEIPALPKAPTGKIILAEKDIPQTKILFGQPGINKDNPDLFPLRVANYILGGGGFNSRMMREIRSNRGLAYSVYSYFRVGRRLPELFIASSETKCESTVEVVSIMRDLMEQLRDEPVTQQELELAKKSLINSFVFAFSDTHSIVSRKVRLDFFNYPDNFLETYRDNLAKVSIDDVQRVARKYLAPDQMQIVLVGDSRDFSAALKDLDLPVEKIKL